MRFSYIKTALRTAAVLLAALTLLSSCSGGGAETDSTEEETGTSPVETEAAREPFMVIGADGKSCTVIRADGAEDEEIALAVKVRDRLESKTGKRIDIGNDFLIPGRTHPEDTWEIIVGKTNYTECTELLSTMRYNDFAVIRSGRKIIITGQSNTTISKAVTWFLSTGLSGLRQEEDGSFTLEFDDYRFEGGYKVKSLTLNGHSISDYRIVWGKSAGRISEAGAGAVASVLAQATGYLLPVVPDTAAETPLEILVGPTSRLENMKSDTLSFGIYMSGEKLVIDCNGSVAADRAVRKLYTEKMAEGGDIALGPDISVSGRWSSDTATPIDPDADIRVMSYNILTEKWGGTDTAPRAEMLGAMLDAYSPDIVGIQEVCSIWVKYLPVYCPGYAHVCLVRPDGGENYSTVLYKKDKYELVDSGVVMYSMTANLFCRNMGWVVLRDRTTGKNVALISTHWDFDNAENNREEYRRVQAREITAKVKQIAEKYGCPVFTTGDYNARHDSASIDYFRSINDMWCSKFDAAKYLNDYGSASSLGTLPSSGGGVIDFVFGTKDIKPLVNFIVVDFDTKDISDHHPVILDAKLP